MTADGPMLILDDDADVAAAMARSTWLSRVPVSEVRVGLPGLTVKQAQASARRIRRSMNDCGCRWGEAAMALTALVLWWGPVVAGGGRPGLLTWILLLITAATCGKLAGLAASRAHLRTELRRIAAVRPHGGDPDGRDLS